jgi:hypothetical protein
MEFEKVKLRMCLKIQERTGPDAKVHAVVALGQAESGRYLRVIYVPDPELDSIFVIPAYELTGKPLLAYRRRRRKKENEKGQFS